MFAGHTTPELWNAYFATGSDEARNALMERYLPLVQMSAVRLALRSNRNARCNDVEELFQYGAFGLRDAISKFDPSRGVKFETYGAQRVRGAMLDGLKKRFWMPRDLGRQVKRFAEARERARAEFGAGLHEEVVSERMGVREETIRELETHLARLTMSSLDATEGHEETSAAIAVADYREEEAPDAQQREDVRQLLMKRLTRSERQMMMLYYYENMTMREIADVLGISATRVSQMHSEIVDRLRDALGARVNDSRGRPRAALAL